MRWRQWAAALVVVLSVTFVAFEVAALTPIAVERTEQGELAIIDDVCRTLRPADTVVVVDDLWTPIIRNVCGLPVAQLEHPTPVSVQLIADSIRAAGRTPVIAGQKPSDAARLGLIRTNVVSLTTQEDQQQLVRRPDGTMPLFLQFWVARP